MHSMAIESRSRCTPRAAARSPPPPFISATISENFVLQSDKVSLCNVACARQRPPRRRLTTSGFRAPMRHRKQPAIGEAPLPTDGPAGPRGFAFEDRTWFETAAFCASGLDRMDGSATKQCDPVSRPARLLPKTASPAVGGYRPLFDIVNRRSGRGDAVRGLVRRADEGGVRFQTLGRCAIIEGRAETKRCGRSVGFGVRRPNAPLVLAPAPA